MTGVGDKIKNVVNKVTGSGPTETAGTHGTHGTHGSGAGYGTGAGTASSERSAAAAGMTTQSAGQQYGTTEQQYASQEQYGTKEQYASTGTTTGTAAVGEAYETGRTGVCSQEYFTKSEDRPIVKERVEYIKEHRPVEKEFVVETRATGREREVAEGRVTEHLGTTERIVSEAQPRSPCQ